MVRKYKEDTPIGTITKIRNILSHLSILPYEKNGIILIQKYIQSVLNV